MSNFGKNIKKIRFAKKLSQTQFAELFNLKRTALGAYEEGRAEAKINTIIEIAKYFNLTLNKLLTEELTVNDIFHFNHDYLLNSIRSEHLNTNYSDSVVYDSLQKVSQIKTYKFNNSGNLLNNLFFIKVLDIGTNILNIKNNDILICSKNEIKLFSDIFLLVFSENKGISIIKKEDFEFQNIFLQSTLFIVEIILQ